VLRSRFEASRTEGEPFAEWVPGVTIDRQCGSSQQAVHFAAQAVLSGTADLVVAGGVQNMSQVPVVSGSAAVEPLGLTEGPFHGSEGWVARYGKQPVSQFHGAEQIAERGASAARTWRSAARARTPAPSSRDRRRTLRARDRAVSGFRFDEGPRRGTSLEQDGRAEDPGGRGPAHRGRLLAHQRRPPRC
jgi:acetyl-CoA C-acetyltransferase